MIIIAILSSLVLGFILVLILNPKDSKQLTLYTLISSLLCFFFSLCVWATFDSLSPKFQHITFVGILVGVDGISLYFLLLTTFLFPICILISWGISYSRLFLACLLLLEFLLILVFLVIDLLCFYIFFESVLIPIFILIINWGSRSSKVKAAYFFFIYTLLGSLVILSGIMYIYSVVGTTLYLSLCTYEFTLTEEKVLWLTFFISFSVKVPIVPFHIWLPEAHVEAPTIGSAILAGILLKLGIYGFIRYSLPLFPDASVYFTPLVITICVVGIFYSSVTAIRQTDIKRIIAYTSIAHINLVVIGIFSFTLTGLYGSLVQSLSHGFVSTALFLLVGTLYDRYHSRFYLHYSGLTHLIPIFSFFFLVFSMANIALPGISSFVGEFLLLLGLFEINPLIGTFGAFSIIMSGFYSLWLLNRIIYGSIKLQYISIYTDLNRVEVTGLSVLLFVTLFVGIYPEIIFKDLHSSLGILLLNIS